MGSIPQVSALKGQASLLGNRLRLHQIFSETARRERDNPAIIQQGVGQTSYSEAESGSRLLSRGLLRLSPLAPNQDGDKVVAVCLPPSADLVLALLAVWKSGAAYLPLEPGSPPQRVRHILLEARPALVITTQEEEGVFSGCGVDVTTVAGLRAAAAGTQDIPLETATIPHGEDPIEIILYTSGSTGLSKGVRIRNSSCLNRLQWGWRQFPFSASERVCVFKTALTFVDSVPELWGSLLAGRPVLVLPKEVTSNPQRLVPVLHQYKIGRLILVPTLLKSILTYLEFSDEKSDVLSSLKLWVCSGEMLSVPLAREFFSKFGEGDKVLCNFYGSTEVMGDVTYHVMRAHNDVAVNGKVPIGNPVENTVIYLLDKDLEIVAAGEVGELYVGGRHIAAGYVNGRDAFRFIESPHTVDPEYKYLFKTGDFGRVEKGTLLYEGRTDSQIKVRGHRVDLSEVETALGKVPGIAKGVVLCYRPGEAEQEVLGFVLLQNGVSFDTVEIEKILKNSLPNYALPQIIILDLIPLLVNGKVDRQYLLRYYQEQSNEEFNCANIPGIANGKEASAECLFKAVYTVLGQASRSKISGNANFYQIGGNSLNSILTIAKLKEAGYTISISDFISAKNLAEVINKMANGHAENGYHQEADKYTLDFIDETYKADIYRIIGDSFFEKADIELTMDPPVKRNDYDILLDGLWPTLVRQKLSIVIKNRSGDVIGTSLFMDVADEPEVHIDSQLRYVFQFLEYLEAPVMETMVPEGKILHSFMLGTDQKLTPQENIEATEVMEREIEGIGRSRSFLGIFTTNTSPLTQQLAENILNYKTLKSYQINQFVAPDGTRPFKRGPDSLIAVCSFKQL